MQHDIITVPNTMQRTIVPQRSTDYGFFLAETIISRKVMNTVIKPRQM